LEENHEFELFVKVSFVLFLYCIFIIH